MHTRTFATVLMAACFAAAPALAQDICYERSGQFASLRHCVTSVRAPQDGTNFGPENLAATGDGAWCAAAERRQIITLYLKPRVPLRTITMTNGYAKSDEIFRQNGRIKRAMIETDTGYKGLITVKDSRAAQKFIIAKGRYTWVRLTILNTNRGSTNPNACLSEFLVNLEEFGND
jgi:hypothetical protein